MPSVRSIKKPSGAPPPPPSQQPVSLIRAVVRPSNSHSPSQQPASVRSYLVKPSHAPPPPPQQSVSSHTIKFNSQLSMPPRTPDNINRIEKSVKMFNINRKNTAIHRQKLLEYFKSTDYYTKNKLTEDAAKQIIIELLKNEDAKVELPDEIKNDLLQFLRKLKKIMIQNQPKPEKVNTEMSLMPRASNQTTMETSYYTTFKDDPIKEQLRDYINEKQYFTNKNSSNRESYVDEIISELIAFNKHKKKPLRAASSMNNNIRSDLLSQLEILKKPELSFYS
jgi:hypothetical protein